MKIILNDIKIRELTNLYKNNGESGVVGYGGKLNIRPPYQREFVYDNKQRASVIESVMAGFPINVMYWSDNQDGTYEILDGQQRTISICEYVAGNFSIGDNVYYHNLDQSQKNKFLDYEIKVYFCVGEPNEKMKWFEIINVAGEVLTKQEIANAVFVGPFVVQAKKIFSKSGGPAFSIANQYLTGSAIRQDYLETAIKWMPEIKDVKEYMSKHQHDTNANQLWLHFQKIISWVEVTFPYYRKEMKGVNWGYLYNNFGGKSYDPEKLEKEVVRLMQDEDITKKSGIYTYLISGDERPLSIRAFSDKIKREVFENQKGECKSCGKVCEDVSEMEADHITPWSLGGKSISSNCQMLCMHCNRTKSSK